MTLRLFTLRTKEAATKSMSFCTPKRRSVLSLSDSAGRSTMASGRFTPRRFLILPLAGTQKRELAMVMGQRERTKVGQWLGSEDGKTSTRHPPRSSDRRHVGYLLTATTVMPSLSTLVTFMTMLPSSTITGWPYTHSTHREKRGISIDTQSTFLEMCTARFNQHSIFQSTHRIFFMTPRNRKVACHGHWTLD